MRCKRPQMAYVGGTADAPQNNLVESSLTMKRYYYELLDAEYNDLGASIPDGWHQSTAINQARAWSGSMAYGRPACR